MFEVAARRQVAIEIDGSWDRQDVHYELAARALEHGCLFALDSDAHAHPELEFAEIAIAHARLAGIPQDRIVNYWSNEGFLEWARGAGIADPMSGPRSVLATGRLLSVGFGVGVELLLMLGVPEREAARGKLPCRPQRLGQCRIVASDALGQRGELLLDAREPRLVLLAAPSCAACRDGAARPFR